MTTAWTLASCGALLVLVLTISSACLRRWNLVEELRSTHTLVLVFAALLAVYFSITGILVKSRIDQLSEPRSVLARADFVPRLRAIANWPTGAQIVIVCNEPFDAEARSFALEIADTFRAAAWSVTGVNRENWSQTTNRSDFSELASGDSFEGMKVYYWSKPDSKNLATQHEARLSTVMLFLESLEQPLEVHGRPFDANQNGSFGMLVIGRKPK